MMMSEKENAISTGIRDRGILTEFKFSESFVTPRFLTTTPVVLSTITLRLDDTENQVWLNAIINWAISAGPVSGTADLLFEILRGNAVIYSIAQSGVFLSGSTTLFNAQLQHVDDNPLGGVNITPAFVQYQLRVTPVAVPGGITASTLSQVFTAAELKPAIC